jgi:hypothetical protein
VVTADEGFVTAVDKNYGNDWVSNSELLYLTTRIPKVHLLHPSLRKDQGQNHFLSLSFPLTFRKEKMKTTLLKQLKLTSLYCTRLQEKNVNLTPFHVVTIEDDFLLINNIEEWLNGQVLCFLGELNPDIIYSQENPFFQ